MSKSKKKISYYLLCFSKAARKYRGYTVFVLILGFIAACLFAPDWKGWKGLADIGTFFTGIGVLLAAWQMALADRVNKKDQYQLALTMSRQIQALLNKLSDKDESDIDYITIVKELIVTHNRLILLLQNQLIDFEEVYILSGNNLVITLGIAFKTLINNYGELINDKIIITDEFVLKYKDALIELYEVLTIYDKSAEIFDDEAKRIKSLKPRQESLSNFV